MSKLVKNEKALKAVMAGAVAFTPVIAIGVNVEKADAATVDETASTLAKKYVDLGSADSRKQQVLDKVMDVLYNPSLNEDNVKLVSYFIADNAYINDPNQPLTADERKTLIDELTKLAKPFTSKKQEDVQKELKDRFDKFTTATQPILKDAGNVQDLLDYINSIIGGLIDAAGSEIKYDKDNYIVLDDFYTKINEVLFNSNQIEDSMRNILEVPSAAEKAYLITAVEKNVPKKPPVVDPNPGPSPTPTPTPENPVVDDKKGQVAATADAVVSNPQSVIDAIKNAEQIDTLAVALKAGADDISIPFTVVSALKDKNGEAIVAVSAEHATYHLPVAEINSADIARQLGVATSELKLVVSMEKVTNPLTGQSTYKVLSDAVDFKASLQAPNGKSVELTVFFKPVQRTILSTQTALDPVTTVGVLVDANGNITAVPTYVQTDKKNADLYRAGNSTYTLIQNFKTFNDVDNGKNWAEDYIERLASKMVVNGTTATTFAPDRSISRGEFAALLSRGLGLTAQNKNVKFSDVSANQAFNQNGEIASVVEAGIVQGDKNGKFRPYDTITRDEAAIMISRAMDFIDSQFVKIEPGKKVSHFEDYRYIGGTARPHVEKVYQAGYLGGFSNGTFGPAKETERAQMAKILYNFLQSIHYIN